jgi:hypothetical protein
MIMRDNRYQILEMLANGRISADEAARLLAALEKEAAGPAAASPKAPPKYMRVMVDAQDRNEGPVKVNVRVPMQLLRAGVRLSSLIPPVARERVNDAMRQHGVNFDLTQIKPENLEEVVNQLNDLTVEVDSADAKVRVFCE